MIETNIRNAMLNDTTISATVGSQVYFPFAPKGTVGAYISFFQISDSNEFYETHNDDLFQFDIYVDQKNYDDAQILKNAIKTLFLNAHVEDCTLNYITSTNEFQSEESKYRIIMTYRVNSKI